MAEEIKLNNPWLVAVWPGMGQVAISAGYYLAAKLGMHVLAEFSPEQLFDVEHVEVKGGLIQAGRLPRSRVFVWRDPQQQRDLVVFIGEAQPPAGKYAFCQKLIQFARELGVQRVFTFAAMATQMHPEDESRVFCAAIDEESLGELKRLELDVLEDGHIGGLNGVLLGAAAENGMRGACLLGEMPHVFAQVPFPKASLAVLEAFTSLSRIELDLSELAEQAKEVQQKLGELLARFERAMQQGMPPEEEEAYQGEPAEEGRLSAEDQRRVEKLFAEAGQDRSKAYALKQELDRLGVFRDYEDRFLDLFQKPG
jgi:proteasome assembly chaperone (PAC2) family protein